MEINGARRTIRMTILYYGPALGGKTTNLQALHRMAVEARRGEMISVNTMQDRTLLFDLLPIKSRGLRGYELEIRLMAVPGQLMYAASRRVAMRTADALVFVANSAADRVAENVESFREMKEFLKARGVEAPMPTVVQYNKRDLPAVASMEELDRALGLPEGQAIPAVATDGRGLLETLSAVLMRLITGVCARHPALSQSAGESVPRWVARTLRDAFGPEAGEEAPAWRAEEDVTKVRVGSAAEEAAKTQPHGAPLEARLADRYVEAAWQLSTALDAACAERDAAERRLHDLRHALAAAQALQAGRSFTATLQPFLARTTEAGDAVAGAFLVPDAGGQLETVAAKALLSDPLQQVSGRARAALAVLPAGSDPQFLDPSRHSAVRELLDACGPSAHAVLALPFRTGRGLQGLMLLLYAADQPRPRPRVMMHLAHMAGAVTAALELGRRVRASRPRRTTAPQEGPARTGVSPSMAH